MFKLLVVTPSNVMCANQLSLPNSGFYRREGGANTPDTHGKEDAALR
jgi:hypothetical protein